MSNIYFEVERHTNKDDSTDIGFRPVGSDPVPPRYLEFKSDVENFVSVVNFLYKGQREVRENHIEHALNLAELGFSSEGDSDLEISVNSLNELKSSILYSSWNRIRNRIVFTYGLVSVVFLALIKIVEYFSDYISYSFFTLLLGAAVGSWISLAVRTKNIDFDSIRAQLHDIGNPLLRIIFTLILSSTFAMFLSVGLVELNIGPISTTDLFADSTVAFSIGVLFGFSEKYLIETLNTKAELISSDPNKK